MKLFKVIVESSEHAMFYTGDAYTVYVVAQDEEDAKITAEAEIAREAPNAYVECREIEQLADESGPDNLLIVT